MTPTTIANLRKASTAVYLACEAPVADDISNLLRWAADRMEKLQAYRDAALAVNDHMELSAGGDAYSYVGSTSQIDLLRDLEVKIVSFDYPSKKSAEPAPKHSSHEGKSL